MRKGGGTMGSNNGSMLVAPTADGTRPGYYGSDAGFGSDSYKDASAAFDAGSGSGENNSQGITYQDVRNNASIQAGIDNAAREKAKQQAAAAKEQKRIQDILDSYKGKEPAAYGYGSPIVNPYNKRFGPKTKRESIASKFRKLALKDLVDKKRGDKQLSFSAPLNFFNSFKPSRQDVDYSYDTPITTDMMNVNETDYIDQGNYGLTGKNMTDIDRINRALDDGRSLGNITQKEFEDAFNSQNINTSNGGDGNPNILPQYAMMGGGADMGSVDVVEPYTNDFEYRFGTGQNVGANVLRGYAADGGIMGTRARRAMGGIMGRLDQRQGYFLGSIVKGVKSAVSGVAKAAGKVLKSDLGKAAILAGGYYYGGGSLPFIGARTGSTGFGTMGGFGLSGLREKVQGSDFLSKALMNKDSNFSPFKVAGLFATAAPFLGIGTKAKQDSLEGFSDRGGQLIDPLTGEEGTPASMRANIENAKIEAGGDPDKLAALNQAYNNMLFTNLPYANYGNYAQGGRIKAQEGGLMNLGGMEKDYRAEGGFVPIGKQEKADDVPARLSVNEFVFTADAVRNAGEGDIDKGAEVMENMMKNLENGGTVSEESQGNTGAQNMFSVSERIGEVI